MNYVGYYAGDLSIKVNHRVNENTLSFSDAKENWESTFNNFLENLIKEVLPDFCEDIVDVEVVLNQDYAVMNKEGDDHAGEKLQH